LHLRLDYLFFSFFEIKKSIQHGVLRTSFSRHTPNFLGTYSFSYNIHSPKEKREMYIQQTELLGDQQKIYIVGLSIHHDF
jgi:hypothetical protein